MAGNARDAGRSVSSRLLAVLAAFGPQHRQLTLSQIARRADLAPATAHRLVGELEGWHGLIRREDGRYEIGRRLWDLGLLAAVQHDLREVSLPYLQDVHATTGETVHIAIREQTSSLYVERISGRTSAQVISTTGSLLPLHATAVGKVLLAHAPPQVLRAATQQLERITRYTIVEPGRLMRELQEIRRRGYARTAEELTYGAYSAAVPVSTGSGQVDSRQLDSRQVDSRQVDSRQLDSGQLDSGHVVAALGIVVSNPRRDLARLVPVLQVAASAIGRSLPADWQPN